MSRNFQYINDNGNDYDNHEDWYNYDHEDDDVYAELGDVKNYYKYDDILKIVHPVQKYVYK